MRVFLLLTAAACALCGQTAQQIMSRVAANQDHASAARAQYVYHQNLLVRMSRANGKLAREETRDYTVTPQAGGVQRDLVGFSGKIGMGKKVVTYDNPDFRYKEVDLDGELVQSFADGFGSDKKSNDGVQHDLFPLRSDEQKKYRFTLTGVSKYQDRDVWQIAFEPGEKRDIDDDCWAGEALIDKAEYEPVLITSHLACKIPVLVKTMLGTNVRQIGFKVTYKKFEDGVWFPVTYGGEFQFRVVFVYARNVGIGLVNSGFQRAKVDTAIRYANESVAEPHQ
jgi:hypothetical protein